MISLHRRNFVAGCGLVAGGFLLGSAAGRWPTRLLPGPALAEEGEAGHEARLKKLGITLPGVTPPRATLVSAVRAGDMLYVSGHGPAPEAGKPNAGKLGKEFSIKEGQDAARRVGLNILAVVRAELGSLDKVVRLVKTLGMVNCTADFTQQPTVINGFSDLMVQVFGEKAGKGARSAVGMVSLPNGIPVEIEAIFQVR